MARYFLAIWCSSTIWSISALLVYGAEPERLSVFAIDIETRDVVRAASEPLPGHAYCGSPEWSLDDRRVVLDATPGRQWSNAALLHALAVLIAEACDRPFSFLFRFCLPFQSDHYNVPFDSSDSASEFCLLHCSRRKRSRLSSHVVDEVHPSQTLDKSPRHFVRFTDVKILRDELACFVRFEPGKVLIPGICPATLLRRIARQVARLHAEHEPAFRVKTVSTVELCAVESNLLRRPEIFGLELIPPGERLPQFASDDARVVRVPRGQQRAVGRRGVCPLARGGRLCATGIMPLLCNLLEEQTLGIVA